MKGILCILSLPLFAGAEALVWEVEKNGNKVILAGTIHMLKPADYPLPQEYQKAFAEADTVVFETDMQAVQTPEFAMKMSQRMTLPQGQSLASVLDPAVYEQLRAFASERGIPLNAMANFEPALIALTLSVLEMQRLGFAEGVDVRYSRMATDEGKAIGALETPDEQLAFIASMTELDADDFIRYTLEDMEQLPQLMDQMVKAFKAGDDRTIYKLGAEPMIEYSPKLYRTLLTDRNRSWLESIDEYLQTPETELVMVGALHLAGPEGVPTMLRERGDTVARY